MPAESLFVLQAAEGTKSLAHTAGLKADYAGSKLPQEDVVNKGTSSFRNQTALRNEATTSIVKDTVHTRDFQVTIRCSADASER